MSCRVDQEEIVLAKSLKRGSDILDPLVGNIGLTSAHQKLLTTALKIKKEYSQRGCYCFLHGNEPQRAVVSWFTKGLIKHRTPDRDVKLFHFMRNHNGLSEKPMDIFLQSPLLMMDMKHRTHLISVDALFLNNAYLESANHYCAHKASDCPIHESSKDFSTLFEFIPSPEERNAYVLRFVEIMEKFATAAECGNLYVFCIPQDKYKDMVYRSHAFGTPCKCEAAKDDIKILKQLQLDQETNFCNQPQYRILSYHLTPENGIRSFLLTPNREAKLIAKREIKELIDDMMTPKASRWTHIRASTILAASYLLFNILLR